MQSAVQTTRRVTDWRAEPAPPASAVSYRWGNPLEEEDWDARVMRHPSCGFFHGANWLRALQATYGFEPIYVAFTRQGADALLVPIMEVRDAFKGTRGVSLPFTDVCAPAGSDAGPSPGLFLEILRRGRDRGWKYYQCRGGSPPMPDAPASVDFFEHTLDLSRSADDVFAGFDSAVRQAIRKAAKEGVKAEISSALEDLEEFYRLHCKTRKRHGLPPQPFAFFRNLHRHAISRGQGWVVLARHDRQPVAGAVFLHLGRRALYKFGASDAVWQHLRGNNVAIWEAIRWYATNGYESLHFGRTSMWNEGLRRFKRGWGSRESTLHYYKYDLAGNRFVTEHDEAIGWHNRVFSALPIALARLVGAMIYRYSA